MCTLVFSAINGGSEKPGQSVTKPLKTGSQRFGGSRLGQKLNMALMKINI